MSGSQKSGFGVVLGGQVFLSLGMVLVEDRHFKETNFLWRVTWCLVAKAQGRLKAFNAFYKYNILKE